MITSTDNLMTTMDVLNVDIRKYVAILNAMSCFFSLAWGDLELRRDILDMHVSLQYYWMYE